MQYLFYILLGLLPSLIWLVFYLRKDKHPEPNSMILKIFAYGMLLAPIAVILELFLIWLLYPDFKISSFLSGIPQNGLIRIILAATLIPALVEESLKYSLVKIKILRNSVFDEPTDAMLYCIITGLGFAAVENLLILFRSSSMLMSEALAIIGFRFIGATFVHALAAGIVGYYIALGLLKLKKKKLLILSGLSIAIIFHACYNYFIITIAERQNAIFYFLIILLILSAAIFVSFFFKKLKKQQSVCIK
jgi:protease PrsW